MITNKGNGHFLNNNHRQHVIHMLLKKEENGKLRRRAIQDFSEMFSIHPKRQHELKFGKGSWK